MWCLVMYSNCLVVYYRLMLHGSTIRYFLCFVLFNTVSLHYKIMIVSGIMVAAHGFLILEYQLVTLHLWLLQDKTFGFKRCIQLKQRHKEDLKLLLICFVLPEVQVGFVHDFQHNDTSGRYLISSHRFDNFTIIYFSVNCTIYDWY